MEQEEVEADDVGILCRVRLGEDAAVGDNTDHDGRRREGMSPVEEVADGIRAVLKEKPEHRPFLLKLLVHLCQLHLLAGELLVRSNRPAPFSVCHAPSLDQLDPMKGCLAHIPYDVLPCRHYPFQKETCLLLTS